MTNLEQKIETLRSDVSHLQDRVLDLAKLQARAFDMINVLADQHKVLADWQLQPPTRRRWWWPW